jgi:hypothetical protein
MLHLTHLTHLTQLQTHLLFFYYVYGVVYISLFLLGCALFLSFWTFHLGFIKKSQVWNHTDHCMTHILLVLLPPLPVLLLFGFVFLDMFIGYSMYPMQIHSVSQKPLGIWLLGIFFFFIVQCIYTLRLIRTVWVVRDWWRVWAYKQQPGLTHYREGDFNKILFFQTLMRCLHTAYSNETEAYTAKLIKSGNVADITSTAFMQGIRAQQWDYPVHMLLDAHVNSFNVVWQLLGFVS